MYEYICIDMRITCSYGIFVWYVLADSPLEEQRFFVTSNTSGDDDAAFKERLKNMGKGMKTIMVN